MRLVAFVSTTKLAVNPRIHLATKIWESMVRSLNIYPLKSGGGSYLEPAALLVLNLRPEKLMLTGRYQWQLSNRTEMNDSSPCEYQSTYVYD